MKPFALIPRAVMANKPPHGAPCNGCGVCCVAVRCDVGTALFGEGGACPALERDDSGKYQCGVAVRPEVFVPWLTSVFGFVIVRDVVLELIYAGQGCDARFNGEPINFAFHKAHPPQDEETRQITLNAFKLERKPPEESCG
jgi:hypothetical protein